MLEHIGDIKMAKPKIDQIREAIAENDVGINHQNDVYFVWGVNQKSDERPDFIDIDVFSSTFGNDLPDRAIKIKDMLEEAGLNEFEVHDGKFTFLNN